MMHKFWDSDLWFFDTLEITRRITAIGSTKTAVYKEVLYLLNKLYIDATISCVGIVADIATI